MITYNYVLMVRNIMSVLGYLVIVGGIVEEEFKNNFLKIYNL